LGDGLSSSLSRATSGHSFIKAASTHNLSYSDAGLFVVMGTAAPGNAAALTSALRSVLTVSITKDDLVRAKNSLKTKRLTTLLGNGTHLAEFIASHGTESVDHYLNRIENITLDDASRVAKSISATKPSVVVAGDVRGVL